jgi:hypothetical protein
VKQNCDQQRFSLKIKKKISKKNTKDSEMKHNKQAKTQKKHMAELWRIANKPGKQSRKAMRKWLSLLKKGYAIY